MMVFRSLSTIKKASSTVLECWHNLYHVAGKGHGKSFVGWTGDMMLSIFATIRSRRSLSFFLSMG